uniref:Uncharacterized protein n=1 Tax=Anguilla anguilla TaxID=7936 RepID=A0A0E9XAQ3_ANGAN
MTNEGCVLIVVWYIFILLESIFILPELP